MNTRSLSFFDRVYALVAQIPAGRVATYGQIALLLDSPGAARAVGYAMHAAPPERDLPCHRVVGRDGRLAPGDVFGGPDTQRRLLEAEGITFRENGCIDLKKHLW